MPNVTETSPSPSASTPVASDTDDFVQPAADRDDDILASDLAGLTRQAHASGWLRDAFFEYDASTLDADARAALQTSADWLRRNPAFSIRIEGHCDERGTEQYNLALGDRRAATARDYLVTLGVDPERVSTLSYGESQPFAMGSDEASWRQNRRAHLVIVSRAR